MITELPVSTNFNRLRKDDMKWLATHRCRHRHTYSEHPSCYIEEYKDKLGEMQRVMCLDIETTNLAANFGYILCYSLKELDGEIIHRTITSKEITTYRFDEGVIRQFLQDIKGVDSLITYYGSRFDIPYLRTRALRWGLEFPGYMDKLSIDVYYVARAKLRTHRKRLETVADLLDIPSKGHRLNPDIWMKAQAGSAEALQWVQQHCDEDVITLEAVYKRLINFRGETKTSI